MMPRNSSKQQSGLTLIELMIALVLGLLLVAGVIQIFVSNKHSYRVTEAHSRLQDNARFALEILSKDIRSAGYSGCRAIENINVQMVANSPALNVSSDTVITGREAISVAPNTWSPNNGTAQVSLPPEVTNKLVGGTDIVTIQKAGSCGGNLAGNYIPSNSNIQINFPNTCNISAGDALMIADCEDAHIFRGQSAPTPSGSNKQTISHPASLNLVTKLCKSYTPPVSADPEIENNANCASGEQKIYNFDAEILRFMSFTYFIGDTANGNTALWQFDHTKVASSTNPLEFVEGIENMQVEYGIDANDDDIVDNYRDAQVVSAANAGAGEWDKVVSARISLLAQTLDQNLTTTNQNVTYDGNAVTGEGRIRRVFTTTIGIRNRVQ